MTKILVLEDDTEVLELFVEALKESGYQVETSTNGIEAWDKISQRSYDFVLLDGLVPGVSGFDLAPKIKEQYPDIKIAICTGFANRDVLKELERSKIPAIDKYDGIDHMLQRISALMKPKELLQ